MKMALMGNGPLSRYILITGGSVSWITIGSNTIRPMNTMLALLLTGLVIPTLPCLLDFTTKTVLCMMIRRLVPRVSRKRRSGVNAVFFTVNFDVVVALSITLKW